MTHIVQFDRPITLSEAERLARALDFDDEAGAVGDPSEYPSDEIWYTEIDEGDAPSFQERIEWAGIPGHLEPDDRITRDTQGEGRRDTTWDAPYDEFYDEAPIDETRSDNL